MGPAGRAGADRGTAGGRSSVGGDAPRKRSTSWRGLPPRGWRPPRAAGSAYGEADRRRGKDPMRAGAGSPGAAVVAAAPSSPPWAGRALRSVAEISVALVPSPVRDVSASLAPPCPAARAPPCRVVLALVPRARGEPRPRPRYSRAAGRARAVAVSKLRAVPPATTGGARRVTTTTVPARDRTATARTVEGAARQGKPPLRSA